MGNLAQNALRTGREAQGISRTTMALALQEITGELWSPDIIDSYESGDIPHISDHMMSCLYDEASKWCDNLFRRWSGRRPQWTRAWTLGLKDCSCFID